MSTLTPSKQEAFEHIEGPHAHTVEDYNRNINASFCADHGLEDKELIFQKGALVAQYPQDFEDIAELDEDDKYHLRREVTSMGVKISTIPIMTSETVPAVIRGGLVMSFQLWVAFGILVEVQAARDLYYAYRQIVEETEAFGGTTFFRRATELLTVPRLRRATIGGCIAMTAQQFSGINIMSFYSSTIFSQAGYTTLQCLLASLGFGLVNVSSPGSILKCFPD
ncbi:putative hexose transport-related protein [Phaeoacremonium minimum UCRPA7]|uniref:Putative hexose transport-related protein n=1 Tax=Phaeoacremonium minimum (strain UCR-PA7) TaxID=1286976 RepID=R8BGR6_PHAM7|nr:putative hexose transport-related protein [Phaeoacremonium minimum UCRPA7]EON98535.1 putative hexose transport-related protein [Phaeoacremonium minimum UCRPA7]